MGSKMVEELIAHCSPTTVVGNRADCGLGLIKEEIRDKRAEMRTRKPKTSLNDTRARLPCDERSPFPLFDEQILG